VFSREEIEELKFSGIFHTPAVSARSTALSLCIVTALSLCIVTALSLCIVTASQQCSKTAFWGQHWIEFSIDGHDDLGVERSTFFVKKLNEFNRAKKVENARLVILS